METRGQGRVVAWIDASAGLAGDMLLGALLDLGADLDAIQENIDAVVPHTVRISLSETKRGGLRAAKAHVELVAADQHHRRWAEIRDRITGAELPERTRSRALATFEALARVEATVHGTETEEVEFHEVGSWDSIADVVGVCAGLEDLGVDEVVVSPIAVGSGFIRGSHGRLPVPGPAVVGLAKGWQVAAGGEGELATPTGVALVTTLAAEQGPIPAMQLIATGVGAGTADREGMANVTRIALGVKAVHATATETSGPDGGDGLVARPMRLLEANVDDLDPRVWPSVVEALLDAGAADAWLTPIVMKRGRPAQVLSVLGHPEDVASLRDLVFELTSTIGLRESEIRRWELERGWVSIEVDGERIDVKIAHRDGRIVQATPEFRDVAAAAEGLRRSVRDVLEAAQAIAGQAGLASGRPLPEGLRS
ncbi:MAG: nickel pincer cofactor biosynthesis protein LarC [Intrasporangium sp.]|uniref:nickel pincer cofactor biosynthesis protein LarC n=1 Tax=Intrasporangium sp. TaxID=1925024 RepID=UPI003F802D98